jgi:hypothetical protein
VRHWCTTWAVNYLSHFNKTLWNVQHYTVLSVVELTKVWKIIHRMNLMLSLSTPVFSSPNATYILNYKFWISVSVFLCLCFFLFSSTIVHYGALTCLSIAHLPLSSSSMVRIFSSCVCRPFSQVVFLRLLIWSGLGPSMEGPSRTNVAEGEIWAQEMTLVAVIMYTYHHNN